MRRTSADTAKNGVEEALHKSSEKLRYALRAARMGTWEWNLTSNEVAWSPETEAIFGVPPGSFGGTYEAYAAFIHPEWLDKITAQVEAYLAEANEHSEICYEHPIIRADGSGGWVEVRGTLSKSGEGTAAHMAGVCADITERVERAEDREALELRLQQAQKMEAVGQLAGGVAHDFNNILTAILGNVDIVLHGHRGELPPGIVSSLEQVFNSAEKAASLTGQLLAFSRRQVTQPRPLNLDDALDGIEPMLRRLLTENIDVARIRGGDLPVVFLDPVQFEQIVMNLAVNARDAMPGGGGISFETGVRTLDEAYCREHPEVVPGPYVVLSVSDTGEGIEASVIERIYEPFFTTKKLGEGTGLGLATVYGIVKQNDGHISVYSESGKGTVFRVYFRVHRETEAIAANADRPVEVLTGTETILVAEDDQSVRELVEQMLRSAGYTAIVAAGGREALEQLNRGIAKPDLLVTDVVMPDMNGKQLCTAVREIVPELPVLYISGYTQNVIAHQGVLDPEVELLEKPFTRRGLLARIREILDR